MANEGEVSPQCEWTAHNSILTRAKYLTEEKGQESISLLIGALRRSSNNGLVITPSPGNLFTVRWTITINNLA